MVALPLVSSWWIPTSDQPKEAVSLVQRYLKDEMLTRELADELETVRLRLKKASLSR